MDLAKASRPLAVELIMRILDSMSGKVPSSAGGKVIVGGASIASSSERLSSTPLVLVQRMDYKKERARGGKHTGSAKII